MLPAISVIKSAEPDYVQDSGPVTYTAVVTNTSVADTLTIDQLVDSVYGDLLTGPVRATCLYGADPVTFPYRLPAGESLRCTFTVTVSATTSDTLTASGTDDEGNRATDAGGAIVTVGITPPPLPKPLPPDPEAAGVPTIALSVDKSAPTKAYRGTDSTSFAYDVRVSNAGPDPAPDTMLNDPAPAGGRFGRIIHQPAQGNCVVQHGGKSLACNFGTITAGQTLSVRLPVQIPGNAPGPVTNTATATCTPTPATTPCKATGSATTRLVAPLTPPRICSAVVLSPSTFRANGVPQQTSVSVRPPAATTVALRGPGVHVDVRTASSGKASATVTPTHAGTLTASANGGSGLRRSALLDPHSNRTRLHRMTWPDLAERFTAGERVRVCREPPAYARLPASPDVDDEGRGLDLVAMLALGAAALQGEARARTARWRGGR